MPTPSSSSTTRFDRRALLKGAAAAALAMGLTGCSTSTERTEITLFLSKPEAISYFTDLAEVFNSSQDRIHVTHDSTSNLNASFVRGNPPDIACFTYNMEMARFLQRGALSDLSDTPARSRMRPELQVLLDQYGTYPGRECVVPYSVTAESVIYNPALFAKAGVEVPTTWSEMLEVCDTLQAAGITPIYGTFKDAWSIAQGLFDYTAGGSLDVVDFFARMNRLGADVGPDSEVSFSKDFAEPVDRMRTLAAYCNQDAASRAYGDGNTAFANGEAAMYFQGPWAFGEIAKTNPDLELDCFPLPMTEDAADTKVRVNIDLALWIPESSPNQAAAREFLEFLMRPDIVNAYNQEFQGFGTTTDAPASTDPRLAGMQRYYDEARMYQGPIKLIPRTIPAENYTQDLVLGDDPGKTLSTLDADWARLARRS